MFRVGCLTLSLFLVSLLLWLLLHSLLEYERVLQHDLRRMRSGRPVVGGL